jgi:hypothetical protein
VFRVAAGAWHHPLATVRIAGAVAAVTVIALAASVAAATVPGLASARPLRVTAGALTPSGLAKVVGTIPKGKPFRPGSFALARGIRFTAASVLLGSGRPRVSRRTFTVWLSVPDDTATGAYRLLACTAAKPSRKGCSVVGKVTVRAVGSIPTVTPTLDANDVVTTTVGIEGGTVTTTAADGTTFTLTVAPHGEYDTPITMTPVTALAPSSAVGRLVDGVMITPLTEAPAGSTLEIKRPGAPRAGSHVVGFGGIDPSGGAMTLPVMATADTTIAVGNFGGYGIAGPATGPTGAVAARAVACERPLTRRHRAAARVAAAGARPLLSCISVADRLNAMQKTVVPASAADRYDLFEAASETLADEMAQILNQAPTALGAAELELMSGLGDDLLRQAELFQIPPAAMAAFEVELQRVAVYRYGAVKAICLRPGSQPSDVYISALDDAVSLARQLEFVATSPSDIASVIMTCANRIKLQLVSSDDATVDHQGGWTSHVVASDTSTITSANLQLTAANRSLSFTTASSQADPSFAASGGSASMISEQGAINPDPLRVAATRRVRCDRNRQLVIERHTYVYVTATNAVFADREQVQIMEGGVPINQPDSVTGTAWAQVTRPKGTQIQIEIGGAPDAEQSAGTCTVLTGDYCTTYSYSASFTATALPN